MSMPIISVDTAAGFDDMDIIAELTGIVLAASRSSVCTYARGRRLIATKQQVQVGCPATTAGKEAIDIN